MRKLGCVLKEADKISNNNKIKALKATIDLMEKETLYFTGKKRDRARNQYFKLLRSCRKECELEKPIYLKRAC
jgi:hypothetical protein